MIAYLGWAVAVIACAVAVAMILKARGDALNRTTTRGAAPLEMGTPGPAEYEVDYVTDARSGERLPFYRPKPGTKTSR